MRHKTVSMVQYSHSWDIHGIAVDKQRRMQRYTMVQLTPEGMHVVPYNIEIQC